MVISLRLFLKWVLLVSLSAVASFFAAFLTEHDSSIKIVAMLVGIITFIFIYTFFEAWARSKNKSSFLRSLKIGVIIKIFLQLIPAIEIFLGMYVVAAIEILGVTNEFFSTYLKTIAMGTVLSGIVFFIASIYDYFHNRRIHSVYLEKDTSQ